MASFTAVAPSSSEGGFVTVFNGTDSVNWGISRGTSTTIQCPLNSVVSILMNQAGVSWNDQNGPFKNMLSGWSNNNFFAIGKITYSGGTVTLG